MSERWGLRYIKPPRFWRLLSTVLAGCCLLLLARPGLADEGSWKFFRGDRFDGHSEATGLADRWPSKGPPVRWSRQLGVGYSGFVGDGDRVFTQYQSLTGQFVICLDAATGKTLWEHRYGWPYKPASLYPGPRSTPTLYGDRVYFTTPLGELGCLDAETGDQLWFVNPAKQFNAPDVEFGYACSPVCIEKRIYLPVGGSGASMVAFDAGNGDVIWHAGDDAISYCSAYPIRFADRQIVVGYFKNKLVLFDRENGEELVAEEVSTNYDEHSAWPIYREPYLWVSGPFRAGSQLFEIEKKASKLRLKLIYKTELMSNDVASSVLVGDAIYGFDLRDVQSKVHRPSRGQFLSMGFATGKKRWTNGTLGRRKLAEGEFISSRTEADDGDVGHSSVVYADGKLLLFNDIGELILCDASPESFEQRGRAHVLGGEICWTPPALIGKNVFWRNHSSAVCVYVGDVDDLADNSQLVLAGDIKQPEYVDLSAIVLGTEPKYAMTAPRPRWLLDWYLISIVLGWGVAPTIAVVLSRLGLGAARIWFLLIAGVFGLLGTTLCGHLLGSFYFSWTIVLALAFEILVCQLKTKDVVVRERPWLARLTLLFFVVVCVAYFWWCRRLSLAFEWTFLIGFPAALPFVWRVKRSVKNGDTFNWAQWLWSGLGFTAFYWGGAGVMIWKYSA